MAYSSLKGKIAIVTGGANGIGAATAKTLASYGVVLALTDMEEDGLIKTANECAKISTKFNIPKPLVYVCDLTIDANRKAFVDQTINTFGHLDILLNIAGIASASSLSDPTMENADKIFTINLRAVYDMCRLTSHHLIKSKGSIINIGSICAHHCHMGNIAYNVTKAGVVQLTKCLAADLGENGVRCNSISPGAINTNIIKSITGKSDFFSEVTKENCPMKRPGEPEEVAKLIAFLVSDESSYINGSDVVIDGGFLVKQRNIPLYTS